MAVTGPPGGRGRMIAGSLRPFTTRRHATSRQREQTRWSRHLQAAGARIALPRAGFRSPSSPYRSRPGPAGAGRSPWPPRVMTSRGNSQQFAAWDDRWAPGTRVARMPACTDAHMAGGWPAEAATTVGVDALARRAPMPGLAPRAPAIEFAGTRAWSCIMCPACAHRRAVSPARAVRAPGVIAATTSMIAPRRGKTRSCGTWSCAGKPITRVTA